MGRVNGLMCMFHVSRECGCCLLIDSMFAFAHIQPATAMEGPVKYDKRRDKFKLEAVISNK